MITVNGSPLPHTPGITVADVLKARNFIFRMLAVSVNGELVPRKAYATTVVPDGADVQVIHMISGGESVVVNHRPARDARVTARARTDPL